MDLSKHSPNTKFFLYETANGNIKVDVILQNETIWIPQKKMAELFDEERLKNPRPIFGQDYFKEQLEIIWVGIKNQFTSLANQYKPEAKTA